MHSALRLLPAVLLLGGAVHAQSAKVSLRALESYLRHTDSLKVEIRVEATSDTEVPLATITGTGLTLKANGKSIPIGKPKSGKVPLRKGSKLTLEVPIQLGRALSKSGVKLGSGPVAVEVALAGADSAKVHVVRDIKDVNVEQLDLAKTRVAVVTNFGTMVVAFRPDKAPKTVANFVKLSKDHFYDNTRFHRVLKNFMIQGGDPNTRDNNPGNDGSGGPGYMIDAEFNDLRHVRGVISMARSRDPNSAGSQFFLMHGEAKHLDNQYTGFGSLVEGLDVLDRIASTATKMTPQGEPSRPVNDVWFYKAIVLPAFKKK